MGRPALLNVPMTYSKRCLALVAVSGCVLAMTSPALAAPPQIVIFNTTAGESDPSLQFEVRLSRKSTKVVKVDFKTVALTATAGEDFIARNGTLRFPAGSKSKTVSVALISDDVDEPSETLKVKLSAPVNAQIEDATGKGTIEDDDEPPGVGVPVITELMANPATS